MEYASFPSYGGHQRGISGQGRWDGGQFMDRGHMDEHVGFGKIADSTEETHRSGARRLWPEADVVIRLVGHVTAPATKNAGPSSLS